jgi:hypothetical protein
MLRSQRSQCGPPIFLSTGTHELANVLRKLENLQDEKTQKNESWKTTDFYCFFDGCTDTVLPVFRHVMVCVVLGASAGQKNRYGKINLHTWKIIRLI